MTATRWYWHVHHDVLCEPLTEPIESRIAYIKANKRPKEIPTRLKLMRPILGMLPAALVQARAAYDQARAAYQQAGAAYWQAGAAYVQARAAYEQAWAAYWQARAAYEQAGAAYEQAGAASKSELEALHRIECPDCPWDGRSIFPEAKP